MSLNNWKPTLTGGLTLEDLGMGGAAQEEEAPASNTPLIGSPPEDAPEAIINTDMREGASTDTTLNDDEIKEMPTWISKINLIEDNKNTLVDMMKVREDIETDGKMNQGTAETIDATFENFLTPTRPRNGFTKNDSKVGYSVAIEHMGKAIRATLESLNEQLQDYDKTEVPNLQDTLRVLQDDGVHCAYTEIRKALDQIQSAYCTLKDQTIVLPFADQQFVNVMCDDIAYLAIDKLSPSVNLGADFKTAFASIQQLWRSNNSIRVMIQTFIDLEKDACDKMEGIKSDAVRLPTNGLTLKDIAAAYTNANADIFYETVMEQVTRLNQDFEKNIQGVENCQPDGYNNVDIIASRTQQIQAVAGTANTINGTLEALAQFSKNVACVFCCLASLN